MPKAAEQFNSCIRVHPGFDQSYLNLRRLYAMQNDKTKRRDTAGAASAQRKTRMPNKAMDALNSLP